MLTMITTTAKTRVLRYTVYTQKLGYRIYKRNSHLPVRCSRTKELKDTEQSCGSHQNLTDLILSYYKDDLLNYQLICA